MNDELQLLALLVHRRLVDAAVARSAMQSGDVRRWLVGHGACTDAQWTAWQQTAAGTRPQLSRYELHELLGEGGTARVFRAIDKTDGQKVALKVLRPEWSKDPVQIEGFVREARMLLELQHPQIVRGRRVAREGDVFFFAMEELPGRCLQDTLAESGHFDEETALEIVADVAGALGALHARGLVHRDVKPGNVIWSEERGAVLIDLGFAVQRANSAGTTGDTTAGTVHYIAPEQARGSGELDVRADIYALGATLYHLVTGSLPFDGQSSEDVLRKQVLESLSGDRIRELNLSPQVHYFIEKMMAKEREIRFQDPQQLQTEVRAWIDARAAQRELEAEAERSRPRLGGPGTAAAAAGDECQGDVVEQGPGFPFAFACKRSGNCCAIPGGFVRVSDAEAIAALLGLDVAAFRSRFVQPDGVTLKEGLGHRCVFLQDGAPAGCAVYAARPARCREWPFWPELLHDAALRELVRRTCPGLVDRPLD